MALVVPLKTALGAPTVRAAADRYLDSLTVANTRRAYTLALGKVVTELGEGRRPSRSTLEAGAFLLHASLLGAVRGFPPRPSGTGRASSHRPRLLGAAFGTDDERTVFRVTSPAG